MNTSQRRTAEPQRRPEAWGWRRQRAWELHEQGWWQKDIAAALGVSRAAVCQWLKRRREGGAEALQTRPQPGRAPRLTVEQRAQLPGLLARGAEAYGFRGDVWTAGRGGGCILRTFCLAHHPLPLGLPLGGIGWTPPRPSRLGT